MKKHILAIGLLLSTMTPALALDVGDISSFMNSDSSTLSKEIKNTTDSGRLINIHMERLSSPLDGGKVIPMDKQDEILLTPASLLLPAKASDGSHGFGTHRHHPGGGPEKSELPLSVRQRHVDQYRQRHPAHSGLWPVPETGGW